MFELALDRGMSGVGSNTLTWQWVDTDHDEVYPATPSALTLNNAAAGYDVVPLDAVRHPASGHVVERQPTHGPKFRGRVHGTHGRRVAARRDRIQRGRRRLGIYVKGCSNRGFPAPRGMW